MIRIYKVKNGQNLFDVALQLSGSIEGIYDLLVCNPDINADSVLENGQDITYHDDFIINQDIVKYFLENNIVIKNGNAEYNPVLINKECSIIIKQKGNYTNIALNTPDSITIDWGDITDTYEGSGTIEEEHGYNNDGEHIIKIYGLTRASSIDFSNINGDVYPIEKIIATNVIAPINFRIETNLFKQ